MTGPGGWSAPCVWRAARPDVLRAPTVRGVGPSVMQLPRVDSAEKPANLLSFLELFAHIPYGQSWFFRLKNGLVLDENAAPLPVDAPYIGGQRITYYRDMGEEPRVPFEETIIYQDAHLLVADKPHFLPVSPTGRYVQETLLVRLKRRTGLDDLAPVHRLDRDTAGLVMFSVQPQTRNAYAALFRERRVHKTYQAIAPFRADLAFPRTHTSRLAEGASFMQMQEVAGVANSETRMQLVAQHGSFARYQLEPVTGRRHQLRVHMHALGVPIVGDQIYPVLSPETASEDLDYSRPLLLLGQALEFEDPVTRREQRLVSERKLDWPYTPASNSPT